MSDIRLNWALGIDNVSSQTALPYGAVTDAINVDISREGRLARRDGYSSVATVTAPHSIWTSPVRGDSFIVIAGALKRVQVPWATTTLQALTNDAPFSYADLNGDVIASSKYDLLAIDSSYGVRRVGLEMPGAPGATVSASGGLDAGTYGVAICYLKGDEEGPLSRAAFVELTAGQGITLAIPQPTEALPTHVRIYRTQANGDVLYRVTDLPLATTPYILGATPLGRQATNQYLQRMVPGDFVRVWRGLLWTVRANVMRHSEPLRYGLIDPRFNFVQDANLIRMFEPVEGGIHYGTKEGTFFLSGSGPKEFTVRRTGGQAPIPGTGRRIPASLLKEGTGEVAIWLSPNGYVLGFADGSISEPQSKRIGGLEGNSGTIAVHDARVLAVVQ